MDRSDSTAYSFGPERVRQLRGELSRAAFSRAVGVTPQTVYRWELPVDAPEARRPRAAQLARLGQLARQAAASPPNLPATRGRVSSAPSTSWVDDDVLRVLPSLERVLRGDLRRGHAELVQLVTNSKSLSLNARAAAHFGIALCELLDRSDAQAALLAIGPLLSDAEAGRLNSDIAAKLFAVAAFCHAFPDGVLFDLGRVHAYQARVESLASGTDNDAACIACIAALCGATLVSDIELLERAFSRLDEARWSALPPLLELHVEEFRGLRAMFAGKNALSMQICEATISRAEHLGYPLVTARSLGRVALCELDALADPEHVLTIARRAKSIAPSNRVGPGTHQLLALRAEIEALLRLGRTEEALLASEEVDAWSVETGLPPVTAVSAQARLFNLTGRVDALNALAVRLRSCELPSMKPVCEAYATHVEGYAALTNNEDASVTVALVKQAEALAGRWPFLLREVLLHRVYAHSVAGHESESRIALRRAQRYVDTFPSPWFTAQLRRLEGGLLAAGGHWNEGRQLLQSAVATFELAKDRCDAALTRYLSCLIADAIEPNGKEALANARRELLALGMAEPRGMKMGVALFSAKLRKNVAPEGAHRDASAERLVVPFQRVAMRGAAPNLILSELMSVTAELFPGRLLNLEEIDSAGSARVLFGATRQDGDEGEWVEFSDGAGRLLRLGVVGAREALDREERATLSLLAMTAAAALEVAVLRSVGERTRTGSSEQPSPELPGFVAASPEMRKLRAELTRLAGSRSTVIITGESGTGKEIVARAIHDLSDRASHPYVAFNCATVPRELFEGQLFGYRRGSFTGASVDHPGVIRAANGGTLFLDEIGELPLDIQPKLLRFLENSEVFPLGERAPVRVNVRVLAATHRDLAALVRDGKFREDLYYRLQVVPVFIPPLRDRRADVPVLARHFLRELSQQGEPPVLAPDALAAMMEQRFPGNVRELKNMIERALAYFPDQPVLRAEHLRLPAPLQSLFP